MGSYVQHPCTLHIFNKGGGIPPWVTFLLCLYTQLTQIYITAIGHSVPFITKFYVIHMWQLQKLMQSVTGNKEYNNDEVSVLWIIVDKKPKKTVHAAQR